MRAGSQTIANQIAPYSYQATDFNAILVHQSSKHLLGTDPLGHDIWSQIIFGARASMEAGVLSTLLALAVAVPIGLAAGYYRGWIDPVIARLTDVLLAFPFLILAVGLAAILGASLRNAILALGIGAAPGLIRIARGEALALREEASPGLVASSGAFTCGRDRLRRSAGRCLRRTPRERDRALAAVGAACATRLGAGGGAVVHRRRPAPVRPHPGLPQDPGRMQ